MTIAISLPGNGANHEALTFSLTNGKAPAGLKGHTVPRAQLHAQAAARAPEVTFVLGMAQRLGWGKLLRKGIHDGAILLTFKSGAIATIRL
jgi:hypothetical protein